MAVRQLNPPKQNKFEKPSRDGPNHSSEHISLGNTDLTVRKEQEETTTSLSAYGQHVEEQMYYADNIQKGGGGEKKDKKKRKKKRPVYLSKLRTLIWDAENPTLNPYAVSAVA